MKSTVRPSGRWTSSFVRPHLIRRVQEIESCLSHFNSTLCLFTPPRDSVLDGGVHEDVHSKTKTFVLRSSITERHYIDIYSQSSTIHVVLSSLVSVTDKKKKKEGTGETLLSDCRISLYRTRTSLDYKKSNIKGGHVYRFVETEPCLREVCDEW